MSDDACVDAGGSTALGEELGGALGLGWSELGSMTDGLTVTDVTAVEVGPSAVLEVQPATNMSTPAVMMPARRRVPRFIW